MTRCTQIQSGIRELLSCDSLIVWMFYINMILTVHNFIVILLIIYCRCLCSHHQGSLVALKTETVQSLPVDSTLVFCKFTLFFMNSSRSIQSALKIELHNNLLWINLKLWYRLLSYFDYQGTLKKLDIIEIVTNGELAYRIFS